METCYDIKLDIIETLLKMIDSINEHLLLLKDYIITITIIVIMYSLIKKKKKNKKMNVIFIPFTKNYEMLINH